jgi:hypothetical protein
MVNWRESQISKGLGTTGFKGDIYVSKMPSSDDHPRYFKYLLTASSYLL